MNARRGTSSGGGASSLGYLFGSDATPLGRPNNRAPPRHPQALADDSLLMQQQQQQQYSGYSAPRSRQQEQYEQAGDPGYDTPASGYETPTGYRTPSGYDTPSRSDYPAMPPAGMLDSNYRPSPMHHQTRAAGKVIHDGGGMSLDMSGGNNNYFRADGQNSGNFITVRPPSPSLPRPSLPGTAHICMVRVGIMVVVCVSLWGAGMVCAGPAVHARPSCSRRRLLAGLLVRRSIAHTSRLPVVSPAAPRRST
jgi:hypothetical protein